LENKVQSREVFQNRERETVMLNMNCGVPMKPEDVSETLQGILGILPPQPCVCGKCRPSDGVECATEDEFIVDTKIDEAQLEMFYTRK